MLILLVLRALKHILRNLSPSVTETRKILRVVEILGFLSKIIAVTADNANFWPCTGNPFHRETDYLCGRFDLQPVSARFNSSRMVSSLQMNTISGSDSSLPLVSYSLFVLENASPAIVISVLHYDYVV